MYCDYLLEKFLSLIKKKQIEKLVISKQNCFEIKINIDFLFNSNKYFLKNEQKFVNVKSLVDLKNKITMKDFFKIIHNKFYPKQDISFMEYFLELNDHKGKFIVHHDKLIEYGIMSSVRLEISRCFRFSRRERIPAAGRPAAG
jgi:hypothetical protein